jgi:DNA-binding SARP family transcriptional activator/tetratricopeptide (TPR) repeat protein
VAPAERLDFRLCGGLRVSRGDEELDLSGTARQGRLALAYLVVNHHRVVGREELMEHLWRDPDPQRVSASLSQTLSRLRQVLGRERLERLPGGALQLRGPMRVDIVHAEQVLKDGRLAYDRGEWASAYDAARRVSAEVAGRVLAGDEADWLEEVRRAVDEVALEALELQASAALRMGEWGEALAAARKAVSGTGLRQSAWALLIEAQARHGDVADATRTYDELRRRLLEESGVTPNEELIELHRLVVTGELTRDVPASRDRPVAFPPVLLLEGSEGQFVGREDALGRLRERYTHAREGKRQFVLLRGEPGIGKTRLACEFAWESYQDGAIVLYGRSDAETLVPYQPFVIAIEHYVDECGDDALVRELGAELSELSRLFPGLARRMPQLQEPLSVEPEMRRFRLFNAVATVLVFVARERPAVLILDDLQWADASTALLLRHTVQQVHAVKLLILGTLRDDQPCRSEQLADFIARPQHRIERISLGGLDKAETAALVMARQGRGATENAVGALLRATGGNPLFLEETLMSLGESDRSADEVSENAVRLAGVSESAEQVIKRRVQRLTDTTQRVLADASVVGAEFDVRVVEAVAEAPAGQVDQSLGEAKAASLVRAVPDAEQRLSFSHALVREALLEGELPARRRRLHHRIGEALEDIGGSAAAHPAELAHHFSESDDPRDAEKALKYSLAAGDEATRSRAYEDASQHFRRALDLLPPHDELVRCEVLLALGRVELRRGSPEARGMFQRASELARRHELPDLLAEAALGFASRYTEAGVVDDEGIALLRAARDALGDRNPASRAEVTARLADSLHFAPEPDEAKRLSQEALTIAREVDDPRALAAALESRHAALLSIEHLDERLRLSQQLVELAQEVGERELEALGRHWRIYDLMEAARIHEAARERRALAALARELRQPLYEHFSVGWDVVWAHLIGKVNEVEPLAQRFYELGLEAQARDTKTIHRAQVMALRRREEQLSDFVSTVRDAVEADPTLLAWRAALPLAHLAKGDLQAAVAEFEWFAHDDFSRVRRDMFWFTTICVLAEICALLRDTARAEVLYELLKPFEHRNVQVTQAVCWGSSERFLGLLAAVAGRFDSAAAHFESAIARNESGGNPASASLVRRDLARLLVLRRSEGDLDRAAHLLREPLRAAQAAQTPSLIKRIQAEIEAVDRERRSVAR